MIISLLRSADISGVEALSTRLTIFSSRTIAWPFAAVPPPSAAFDSMPQDQLTTSISLAWALILRLALDHA